jgi:hypothetical protein
VGRARFLVAVLVGLTVVALVAAIGAQPSGPSAAVAAVDFLDQEMFTGSDTFSGGSNRIGQTFTAGWSASLTRIQLDVSSNTSGVPVSVEILTVDSGTGLPASATLASGTFPGGATGVVDVTFGTPPALSGGTRYAIVLQGDSGVSLFGNVDTYAGGDAVVERPPQEDGDEPSPGGWDFIGNADLKFRTYLDAAAPTPTTTPTVTSTPTSTPTHTPTNTPNRLTVIALLTAGVPPNTATPTLSPTVTATTTATLTPTETPTATTIPTPGRRPPPDTVTPTVTRTDTATPTLSATATQTASDTATPTETGTATTIPTPGRRPST